MNQSFLMFKILRVMRPAGRGLIVIGNLGSVMLSKGELIDLRRPDGTSLQASVFSTNVGLPLGSGFEGLELSPEIQEQDVPPGTEVWFHMGD